MLSLVAAVFRMKNAGAAPKKHKLVTSGVMEHNDFHKR